MPPKTKKTKPKAVKQDGEDAVMASASSSDSDAEEITMKADATQVRATFPGIVFQTFASNNRASFRRRCNAWTLRDSRRSTATLTALRDSCRSRFCR